MTSFTELPLSATMLTRLSASQFSTATPVQAAAIPPALEAKDVLATAQTGTGKTLAFLIPVIEQLLQASTNRSRALQALILTPTRELAMQIADQYQNLRPGSMPPAALVVGGMAERPQIEALRRGAALVVATPGRLEDFLQRRLVRLNSVRVLVLDEADRMLDIGFLPSIRRIAALLPEDRQTLCFSATLAPEVAQLARDCMRDPVRLALDSVLKPSPSVQLRAYEVGDGEKLPLLRQLLTDEAGRCIVFARTKRGTERLAKSLAREGFAATMIHGDRTQSQRTRALAGFQRGAFQVLVATDVAARGIHVEDVAHVVNFDLPEAAEDFVHRIGRTGRAGQSGRASTFVALEQLPDLFRLEKTLGIRMDRRLADGSPAPQRTLPRRSPAPQEPRRNGRPAGRPGQPGAGGRVRRFRRGS